MRQADHSGPPPRLVPWRVPPPGSMGDSWDDWVRLPEKSAPPTRPPKPPRDRPRMRRRDDPRHMVFQDYKPPLHPATIAAWCFIGLSVASSGPLFGIGGVLAGFGLLAAVYALFRMADLGYLVVGRRRTWGALIACVILIALDVIRPDAGWYRNLAERPVGDPSHSLAFEEKIARAERDMALLLEIASCASLASDHDAVALGNASVNHRVRPSSQYFRASSLARLGDEAEDPLLGTFLFYRADRLPLDPFADDFNATFAVYVTDRHVLVYSIGPDGAWQINPRQPVERDDPDPMATLAPHRWLPQMGPMAAGDWIVVGNREELEQRVDCVEVRQRYEARARRGR